MIASGDANVADMIGRHASQRPWAVAIIEQDSVVHYRTLDRLVWSAARHMREAGIRPGDVVGVALPHSSLYLVAIYALARMGAISTALPLSEPAPVRESFARKFGVRSVVAAKQAAGPAGIPTVLLTLEILRQPFDAIPADIRADGGERNWIIRRTSGTTSEAKGIARTHRASLMKYAGQREFFHGPQDRVLAVLDLSMSYGLNTCERTIFAGGTVVMPPLPMGEKEFLDHIDRHAITHVALTPNYLDVLLPHLPSDSCRAPSLTDVSVVGMMIPESLRAEIRRRFSPHLSVKYGSNEAQYLTAADASMQQRYPETVGRALPGVELEIVDDLDRPVAAGVAGHVRARTPWMPTGYVNAPEAAGKRTFRDGWIYTGDIGVLNEEGMLFIRGRVDDMMNYNGIKIMPADIEEALLAHPAVAEAVAFPVPSSRHQHLPMAAVVLRRTVSGEELLRHCRQRLGMRSPLAIAVEASFPRNAMGKVVRRELAEKIARKLPPALL
jgi:acyl-coenzyme A synthetase/AMP-(fatty) acid ligase